MKRYSFNLIEIILTVAVIAFGVVVILGMLPKGLKASRTAGLESYSSEIIDQMASYLQSKGADAIDPTCNDEAAEESFLSDFVSDSPMDRLITDSYTKLLVYNDLSNPNSEKEFPSDLAADFTRTNTAGVFKLNDGTPDWQKDIYIIVMGDTYTDNVGGDHETEIRVDFSGMLRTWKRPRKYQQLYCTHKTTGEHDCRIAGCTFDWTETTASTGAVVCMELSYPLSLPYDQRTKRYYSFEVGE